MARRFFIVPAVVLLAVTASAVAQSVTHGITGEQAPPWNVDDWINLPEGTYDLEIDDLKGNVVMVLGFQTWCPGSHKRALPTLRRLIDHYEGAEDVKFVAIQTTFEGHDTNTARGAWATAEKFGLDIPVGHDGGHDGPSSIVKRYNTAGTPWVVIIGPDGVVRWNDYYISFKHAIHEIDKLRPGGAWVQRTIEPLPKERGGQELIGRKLPELGLDRWIPEKPAGTAAPTLYRWWTNGCVFCQQTLPAIEQLRARYGDKGLQVVGVYHPKPPGEADDETIEQYARYLGYKGAIAVDEDWSALDLAFPPEGRKATSVSLLVDADGVIRFVHPGPVYFPSYEKDHARENADFALLDRAVRVVLNEASNAEQQDPAPTAP